MPQRTNTVYTFGNFRLDPSERLLLRKDEPLSLTPKVFDALVALVQNAGRLVEKDEFMKRLWPETFVGDDTLTQIISLLRKALANGSEARDWIVTVPRRGYRFVGAVQEAVEATGQYSVQAHSTEAHAGESSGGGSRKTADNQRSGDGTELGKASKRKPRWLPVPGLRLVAAAVLTGTLAGALTYSVLSPPVLPKVVRAVQLTHDGRSKWQGYEGPLLLTDGPRIYFVEALENGSTHFTLAQIPASGGETSLIPSQFSRPQIVDLDRSRSSLLLLNWSGRAELEAELWTVPLLGAGGGRVGDLAVSDAAWSPNGEEVVFSRESNLYLAHRDGSDPHVLATLTGRPGALHWSPDGKTVRFTVANPGTRSTSLWEVSSGGTGLRPLLPAWNKPSRECCGLWTWDGRYFVFQSFRNDRWEIWAIKEKPALFGKRHPEPVQLTAGPMDFYAPSPSLDGKKLYVVGSLKHGELVRYDTLTRGFVPYFSGLSAEGLDFSADGAWVTYTLYPEGTLWRSKIDGSERQQLTDAPMRAFLPRWSPDSKEIVFMGAVPGKPWKIFRISANGGSPEQLLAEPLNESDPTWSSDGKQLAFGSPVWGAESAAARPVAIYLMDLETKRVSKVPDSEGLFSPRWSPDGRHLAAVSSDSQRLMVFDFATRKWSDFAGGGVTFPRWSRNSQFIYWDGLGEDAFVRRVRIADRAVEHVASLRNLRKTGAMGAWAGSTPDGSPLLLRFANTEEIYALDLSLP